MSSNLRRFRIRFALAAAAAVSLPVANAAWLSNSQRVHDYNGGVNAHRIAHVPTFRSRYIYLASMFNIPGIPGPNLRPILQNTNGDLAPIGGKTYIRPGEDASPNPWGSLNLFLNSADFYSTSDMGWIVCGRYEEGDEMGGGQLDFGAFLLKVDASLQVQWFMQYPRVNELNSVVEMTDTTGAPMYVAVGTMTSAGTFLSDAIVGGFDGSGNVMWTRTLWGFKDGQRGGASLNDVIVYDNDEVAAVGSGNVVGSSSGIGLSESDVLVTRVRTDGTIVFAEHYGQGVVGSGGDLFGTAETGASLVRVTDSPDLAITGRADTLCISACGPVFYDDKLTFRIDPTGGVVWSNRYDLQGFGEGGVEIRANGSNLHIIAEGETTYMTGTSNISSDVLYFALKDSSGLLSKATEVFGSPGHDMARSLLALNSTGFHAVMLGQTWGFSLPFTMPYFIERLPTIRRRCADRVVDTRIEPHDLPRSPVLESDIPLPQRTQLLKAVDIRPNQRILCNKVAIGDINVSGTVSVADIGVFVTALTRPAELPTTCPECEIEAADINGDGQISVADIGPFVELLTMPPAEE